MTSRRAMRSCYIFIHRHCGRSSLRARVPFFRGHCILRGYDTKTVSTTRNISRPLCSSRIPLYIRPYILDMRFHIRCDRPFSVAGVLAVNATCVLQNRFFFLLRLTKTRILRRSAYGRGSAGQSLPQYRTRKLDYYYTPIFCIHSRADNFCNFV